jgi:hypothetical protein
MDPEGMAYGTAGPDLDLDVALAGVMDRDTAGMMLLTPECNQGSHFAQAKGVENLGVNLAQPKSGRDSALSAGTDLIPVGAQTDLTPEALRFLVGISPAKAVKTCASTLAKMDEQAFSRQIMALDAAGIDRRLVAVVGTEAVAERLCLTQAELTVARILRDANAWIDADGFLAVGGEVTLGGLPAGTTIPLLRHAEWLALWDTVNLSLPDLAKAKHLHVQRSRGLSLPALERISMNFHAQNAVGLACPNLCSVGCSVYTKGLEPLVLPGLQTIGESLVIDNSHHAGFPSLREVRLRVAVMHDSLDIDLSALQQAGAVLLDEARSVDLLSLREIDGTLVIKNCPGVALPALASVKNEILLMNSTFASIASEVRVKRLANQKTVGGMA